MSVNLQSEIFFAEVNYRPPFSEGVGFSVKCFGENFRVGGGGIRINTEEQICAVVRVSVHQKEWVRTV